MNGQVKILLPPPPYFVLLYLEWWQEAHDQSITNNLPISGNTNEVLEWKMIHWVSIRQENPNLDVIQVTDLLEYLDILLSHFALVSLI